MSVLDKLYSLLMYGTAVVVHVMQHGRNCFERGMCFWSELLAAVAAGYWQPGPHWLKLDS
jgi:hypothetical protein